MFPIAQEVLVIRSKGLSFVALLVVLLATAVFAIAFFLTRRSWYEYLALPQQVQFWNEFGVAYGTLALAIVTWASVAETQQVVLGEDLRFRQSRMPMVRISQLSYSLVPQFSLQPGQMKAQLVNTGDGPAYQVRFAIEARVLIIGRDAQTDGQPLEKRRDYFLSETLVSSYLQKREPVLAELEVKDHDPEKLRVLYFPDTSTSVQEAEITYTDAFGYKYVTRYPLTENEAFNAERFEWFPPTELTWRG